MSTNKFPISYNEEEKNPHQVKKPIVKKKLMRDNIDTIPRRLMVIISIIQQNKEKDNDTNDLLIKSTPSFKKYVSKVKEQKSKVMYKPVVEINMKLGDNVECLRYSINDDINEIAHNLAIKNSIVYINVNRPWNRCRNECIVSFKRYAR